MDHVKRSVPSKSSVLDLKYSTLNPMLIDVADRIKSLRKTLGLSQEAFGKLAGVSKSAVSQWERGTTLPERDALMSLQRKRRVSQTWVISGKGDMFLSAATGYEPGVALPDDLLSIVTEWETLPENIRKHHLALIKDHARLYRQESTKPAIIDEYGPTKREKKGEQGKRQKS